MITKMLEIRDIATFIPVLCVDMNPEDVASRDEHYLLRRAGYPCDGNPIVLMTRADGGKPHYDPYNWGDRTMHVAHLYIAEHWGELRDGDVVDVEFILKEVEQPKRSERYGDV